MKRKCPICLNIFNIKPSRVGKQNTCSLKCRTIRYKRDNVFGGKNNPGWKGGKVTRNDGYIEVYSPEHPHKTGHNKVMEHRLVMEKHLGRFLKPKEKVHHINLDRNDNRIENLLLFNDLHAHNRYHQHICNTCGKECSDCN